MNINEMTIMTFVKLNNVSRSHIRQQTRRSLCIEQRVWSVLYIAKAISNDQTMGWNAPFQGRLLTH